MNQNHYKTFSNNNKNSKGNICYNSSYNKNYNSLKILTNRLLKTSRNVLKLGVDFINDSIEFKTIDFSDKKNNLWIPDEASSDSILSSRTPSSGMTVSKHEQRNCHCGCRNPVSLRAVGFKHSFLNDFRHLENVHPQSTKQFNYPKFLERIIKFRLAEVDLSSNILRLCNITMRRTL